MDRVDEVSRGADSMVALMVILRGLKRLPVRFRARGPQGTTVVNT